MWKKFQYRYVQQYLCLQRIIVTSDRRCYYIIIVILFSSHCSRQFVRGKPPCSGRIVRARTTLLGCHVTRRVVAARNIYIGTYRCYGNAAAVTVFRVHGTPDKPKLCAASSGAIRNTFCGTNCELKICSARNAHSPFFQPACVALYSNVSDLYWLLIFFHSLIFQFNYIIM